MKALKIIGIIVAILIAAILIVPLFTPSPAVVEAQIEIALEPEQIFPSVASFENRDAWDPWLTTDSTAVATISSNPGYVGSTYLWEGEMLGNGKMEVISVEDPSHIQSHLWFGDTEKPALVEWKFVPIEDGTSVTWSFTQETSYPFGRLGMIFGKMFLQKSFEMGLADLKDLLESNPPELSSLGPITVEVQAPFSALVAEGSGTMAEISEKLGELYGIIFTEVGVQKLEPAGPAFVHYLDFDENTGISNYLPGVPVKVAGKTTAKVKAVHYPEMKVVRAVHRGPYEKFLQSYEEMEAYIHAQGLEVNGEAFEFYIVNGQTEPDPAKWETVIAFPLK